MTLFKFCIKRNRWIEDNNTIIYYVPLFVCCLVNYAKRPNDHTIRYKNNGVWTLDYMYDKRID